MERSHNYFKTIFVSVATIGKNLLCRFQNRGKMTQYTNLSSHAQMTRLIFDTQIMIRAFFHKKIGKIKNKENPYCKSLKLND